MRSGSRNYPFTNNNWITMGSLVGREIFGLYGYTDFETNSLKGIGLIVEDSECVNVFKTALGDQYTWISPIPGTELSIPVRPAEGNEHIAKLEDQIRTINDNAG